MKKKRTISIFINRHIFPIVEQVRFKHDPLYGKIPPHVTLVFPFTSEMTMEQCQHHMSRILKDFNPFQITLEGTKVAEDGCLFWLVKDGKEIIRQLNLKLYSGPLKEYRSTAHHYIPHITIGRFEDLEKAKAVQNEFAQLIKEPVTLTVDRITLETVGENEASIVEYVHVM